MPFDVTALREAGEGRASDEAPPDGRYEAELTDTTIITANADGRVWCKLTWTVLAGAQRDESWSSMHTLDRYDKQGELNQGLGITFEQLTNIGVDLQSVADEVSLKGALRDFHGRGYEVEVKRRPPYTNTYVRSTLPFVAPSLPGSGGESAPPAAPASAVLQGDAESGGKAIDTSPMRADVNHDPARDHDATPAEPFAGEPTPEVQPKQGDIDPVTGEPIPF